MKICAYIYRVLPNAVEVGPILPFGSNGDKNWKVAFVPFSIFVMHRAINVNDGTIFIIKVEPVLLLL